MPKPVKMSSDPDSGFRQCAVDKLWFYPEGRRAIAERAPLETNPEVLLSLVRLLTTSDAKIREDALSLSISTFGTKQPLRCGG